MSTNTAQRHRQSAIDRLGQIVELAAQGRAALSEGADAAETAALLEALKHDAKAVLEYLEAAAREAALETAFEDGIEAANARPFKVCSSCKREFTWSQWGELKYVGLQKFEDPDINPLELRNCACGSTLSIEVVVLSIEVVVLPNGARVVAEEV